MNCLKCGSPLAPGSKVCNVCGTLVANQNQENVKNDEILEFGVPPVVDNNGVLVQNTSESVPQMHKIQQPIEIIDEPKVIEDNKQPDMNLGLDMNSVTQVIQEPEVSVQPVPANNQPLVQNINENVQQQNVNNGKKKNDTLFYTILGVIAFLIVGVVVYLLFFSH